MTAFANVRGRLAGDPKQRETGNGKPMTFATLCVDIEKREADPQTWFVRLLAFDKWANILAKAGKGEKLAASGELQRGRHTPPDGPEREQWTLVCESVIVAGRTGAERDKSPPRKQRQTAPAQSPPPAAPLDFDDDEIPF